DGTISCSGGLFEASASGEYESAINAQFVKIGGYAHLRRSPETGEVFQAIGPVDFHGAEIGGECVFDDAIITPDLRPRITRFARSRPAFRFDASRIGEEFSLDRASITGGAVFDWARIEGDLSIVGTSLEAVTPQSSDQETLSLALSQVRGRLVWGPKKISGPVSLRHAEFGMLDDEKGAWSGCRVELSGLKYSGLGEKGAAWSYKERLEWLDSSESKTESQPYDQIIRVFRDSGRENDAREIAIEKQRRLRAFARSSERRLY